MAYANMAERAILVQNTEMLHGLHHPYGKDEVPGSYISHRVEGRAMEPELSHGDYVICDPADRTLNDDLFLVETHNNVARVTYMQLLSGGRVRLFGANSGFGDQYLTYREAELLVVGRVVATMKRR